MNAGTQRSVRSILAIGIAALWRVLISSPRVMAGELPLMEKGSGPGFEFHVAAIDVPPEKCLSAGWVRERIGCTVSSPSPSTLGEGWGEGHLHRALKTLTPRPLPEYRAREKSLWPPNPSGVAAVGRSSAKILTDSPLIGTVPTSSLTSAASATMVLWFRRAPAAAT